MMNNKLVNLLMFFGVGLGVLLVSGCKKPKPLAEMEILRKKTKAERKQHKRHLNEKRRADGKLLAWELQDLLRKNPSDVVINYQLADLYRSEGRFTDAANLYKLCSVYSHNKKEFIDPLLEQDVLMRQENARYWEVFCRNSANAGIHHTCELSPLEDVIRLCNLFARDYPTSRNLSSVLAMKSSCHKRLLDKSQSIFNQYCDSWYAREMNKREQVLAAGDKVAAEKVLEKMKHDFDVNDPEIAPRIVFSEYKMARIAYKVAQMRRLDFIKQNGKTTSASDSIEALSKIETNSKQNFISRLNLLTNDFSDTKEAKAAMAMARDVVTKDKSNLIPGEHGFSEDIIWG